MPPSPSRWTEGVVLALERGHVSLSRLDGQTFVRLNEGRVADHVREHHRDEPAVELLRHSMTVSQSPGEMPPTGFEPVRRP